jgi:hypothetical protein
LLAAIVVAAQRKVAALCADRYSTRSVDISDEEPQRLLDLASQRCEFAAQ